MKKLHQQKMATKSTSQQCFSLTELLVVIAILMILLSLLSPSLRKALTVASTLKCSKNMNGIASLINIYSEDHDDFLPQRGGQLNLGYNRPSTSKTGIERPDYRSSILRSGYIDSSDRISVSARSKSELFCPEVSEYKKTYGVPVTGYKVNVDGKWRMTAGGTVQGNDPWPSISLATEPSITPILVPVGWGDWRESAEISGYDIIKWKWWARHDNKGNFLYLDGHLETIDYERWLTDLSGQANRERFFCKL